jgi:hypothetical protein
VQLPAQIIIKTVNVYPEVPPERLTCPAEPLIDPDSTVEEGFVWAEDVRMAGGTCRATVKWWQDYVKSWPVGGN